MKRWLPWIITAVFAAWILGSLRVPAEKDFAYRQFGRLPIIANGRTQPIDSLARNTLLQIREKQTANLEPWKGIFDKPKIIPATEWILGVMTKPEESDNWPVFRIDNPDVKGLLALPPDPDKEKHQDGKHYSWNQIQPKLADLRREAARANEVKPSHQNPYDQALLKLWGGQTVYNAIKNTLGPASTGDLNGSLKDYLEKIEAGWVAFTAKQDKEKYDEAALDWLDQQFQAPIVVPMEGSTHQWKKVPESLVQSAKTGNPTHFSILAYNKMAGAYRAGRTADFNAAVADYENQLADKFPREIKKAKSEQYFNHIEPFYKAMILYVAAFLVVLGFWVKPAEWNWMRHAAVGLVIVAAVVHTTGLIYRMSLEGRPPVTNLYSSAIFIGWGATILGLVLEKFWRNSIGLVVSASIGFITLIIAHHLSLGRDTMEMMEAVLDTNLWLATHVVVVTLGYASTFVAGFLAIIFILRGVFTPSLTEPMRKSLARMTYGIICFAALFSFVGTVLGGIWSDQSWGRFWGWDAKENGALIIVLWNALILHARWGGMVRERGLAVMAIVGNIVTGWSWFGVNMLGIGLHSYGFTSQAFKWLVFFGVSQLVLIALGSLPLHMWRSYRTSVPSKPTSGGEKKAVEPALGGAASPKPAGAG
jgi:ABC-type transport system involved in cytochrome c biogenesis permease subunit